MTETELKQETQQERERGITITHVGKQETLEEDLKFPIIIENGLDYLNLTTKIFNNGAKWQQEKICDLIQRIRASKSDAEARRIIKTI
jgi:hypothetical protein